MFAWNRRLWRTALRLQETYAALRAPEVTVALPYATWREVEVLQRRLTLAREHGLPTAARHERAALIVELERFGLQIGDLVRSLRRRFATLPSARLLYDELTAVEVEFGPLEFTDDTIGITTEPITLEEVELGRFAIVLATDRLGEDAPYRVVAQEPNPASSCSETTHPHVHGEQLCAGDGRAAISAALAEGRLFDFFMLVERVLRTYAEGRAFVELAQWHGVPCYDCDVTVADEERYVCDACERTVCGDCVGGCEGCSNSFCNACLDCCAVCECASCRSCLESCDRCRRAVCAACRDGELCETCREELEDETETDQETPDGADAAEPAV